MAHRRLLVMLALVAANLSAGCGSLHSFFGPATSEQQRLRATIHDPYPDPQLGPEVVGGRPREYIEPLPEPVRNRLFVDSWWPR